MEKKLNILIIGGNGFIGSHLVEVLMYEHNITVFDKTSNPFVKDHTNVEYIYSDFTDTEALSKALEHKDIVYHLVSTTVPYTANLDPVFDIETNLITTVKLLDKIKDSSVKRFIYSSSGGTVYGKPQYLPIDEKHPCSPIGSYGIIKKTIEHYIQMYANKNDFSYLIIRPSNPYGPRQNYMNNQGLMAKFLYHTIKENAFTVWGDGTSLRDYIYIDDLIRFFKIAGLSNESGIFNAGSEIGNSINEIIRLFYKIVNKMPQVIYTKKIDNFVEKVVLDMTSSKQTFEWQPEISLNEGLELHYRWMLKHCK